MTSKKEKQAHVGGDQNNDDQKLSEGEEMLGAVAGQPGDGGGETKASVELQGTQKGVGRTQSDIHKAEAASTMHKKLLSSLKGSPSSQPNIRIHQGRTTQAKLKQLSKKLSGGVETQAPGGSTDTRLTCADSVPQLSKYMYKTTKETANVDSIVKEMAACSSETDSVTTKFLKDLENKIPTCTSDSEQPKAEEIMRNMENYLEQIDALVRMNNNDHVSFKCFMRNVQLYEQYIPIKTKQDHCPEYAPLFTVFLYAKVIDHLIIGAGDKDFRFLTWDLGKDALMDSVAAILGNATGSILLTVDRNQPADRQELNTNALDKYCDVLSRFFAHVSGVDFAEIRHLFSLEENAIRGSDRCQDETDLTAASTEGAEALPTSIESTNTLQKAKVANQSSDNVNDVMLESLANKSLTLDSDNHRGFSAGDIDRDWPEMIKYIRQNKTLFDDFVVKSDSRCPPICFTPPWDMIRRLERIACVITNTVLQKEMRLVKNRIRVLEFLIEKKQLDGAFRFFDDKYGEPDNTMVFLLATLQKAVETSLDEEMERFEANEISRLSSSEHNKFHQLPPNQSTFE